MWGELHELRRWLDMVVAGAWELGCGMQSIDALGGPGDGKTGPFSIVAVGMDGLSLVGSSKSSRPSHIIRQKQSQSSINAESS